MPAQLTTMSQAMRPLSPVSFVHDTPVIRLPFFSNPVTLVRSTIFAPRIFAPLASASAMLAGSPWPSLSR